MKQKKAQGISINTIIIAAIALIVMVLLILIFTGNIRNFRTSAGACVNNGGTCVGEAELGDDGLPTGCNDEYDRFMKHLSGEDGGCANAAEPWCCIKT
jgi:uncharacterized membrane protein YqiK